MSHCLEVRRYSLPSCCAGPFSPPESSCFAARKARIQLRFGFVDRHGKTHLLYAQYREIVLAGKTRCHVRTTRELVEELRRAELEDGFISPVIAVASGPESYHLFWDDIDKLKPTDFKTEVFFDLVDTLYRQKHGLTVTGTTRCVI